MNDKQTSAPATNHTPMARKPQHTPANVEPGTQGTPSRGHLEAIGYPATGTLVRESSDELMPRRLVEG